MPLVDLLYNSGLVDYILGFCQKDVDRLQHMADRMISFDNLKDLMENIQVTSPEQIDRLTDEFKQFKTETNPEFIKHLGDIIALNDPLLNGVKENIENAAYEAVTKTTE